MFKENSIYNIDKDKISYDDFIRDIKDRKNDFKFYVGADSQMYFDHIVFVVTICFHNKFKGAGAYYIKKRVPRKEYESLRARMSKELFLALETAVGLQEKLSLKPSEITVHLDIGSNPNKNKTHIFHKEFVGIVKAQGFEVEIKPNSWASSEVADWFTK